MMYEVIFILNSTGKDLKFSGETDIRYCTAFRGYVPLETATIHNSVINKGRH